MVLNHIRITNFRCFEKLDVPLDRHLNVFIGRNGGGKTTLLDAIALLLAPILNRLPFEKKERLPSLSPSDIRLLGNDRSAPYVYVDAASSANGDPSIHWGRTRSRDASPATKTELPANRKDQKELQQFLDRIIDAHNNEAEYFLPVFAYYGTNRAVTVPHNRLQQRAIPKQFRRLSGLEGALSSAARFSQRHWMVRLFRAARVA